METQTKNNFRQQLIDIEDVPKSIYGVQLSESDRNRLSYGEYTSLLEDLYLDNGSVKDGKVKLSKNKNGELEFGFIFRNDQLEIPTELFGKKLTNEQIEKLDNGKTVAFKDNFNNDVFLKVDNDLNRVVVSTSKQIGIPNSIGNYELSPLEKESLANNKELKTHVFLSENGAFLANVSLTDNKNGIIFSNIKAIENNQVSDLIDKYNSPDPSKRMKVTLDDVAQVGSNAITNNDIRNEINEINEYVNDTKTFSQTDIQLISNKIVLVDQQLKNLYNSNDNFSSDLKNNFYDSINTAYTKSGHDFFKNASIFNEPKKENISTPQSATNSFFIVSSNQSLKNKTINNFASLRDAQNFIGGFDAQNKDSKNSLFILEAKDKEFHNAIANKDFNKLYNLSEQGHKPSSHFEKFIHESPNLSNDEKISVQTILGFDSEHINAMQKQEPKTENNITAEHFSNKYNTKDVTHSPDNKEYDKFLIKETDDNFYKITATYKNGSENSIIVDKNEKQFIENKGVAHYYKSYQLDKNNTKEKGLDNAKLGEVKNEKTKQIKKNPEKPKKANDAVKKAGHGIEKLGNQLARDM